ncbi:hypothetical protein [Gottfriedia acidiceleris]|uniref:hypothetical protein n=1 Tax=Gottfriedia acidiceleris TaxID=371036 RepID=UPI000B443067|nr:hypothetical protein [Gottfriedia acidiceleris]
MHKVKIIYTSSEHIQSTNRALLGGILFVFAEEDGKNIARKSSEVRRAYPAQKYGFVRSEDKKCHIYNPDKKETILLLFEKLQLVNSEEEFLELVKQHINNLNLTLKNFFLLF